MSRQKFTEQIQGLLSMTDSKTKQLEAILCTYCSTVKLVAVLGQEPRVSLNWEFLKIVIVILDAIMFIVQFCFLKNQRRQDS